MISTSLVCPEQVFYEYAIELNTLTSICNYTGLRPKGLPIVELVRISQVTCRTGQVLEFKCGII